MKRYIQSTLLAALTASLAFGASLWAIPPGSTHAAAYVTSASGQVLSSVSTYAGRGDYALDEGTVSTAAFRSPEGLAFLPDGRLLVSDANNQLIRVISEGQVSDYAGTALLTDENGLPLGTLADGERGEAAFNHPLGMAADARGNVFVADKGNHAVRKITSSGEVVTVAGDGVRGDADGGGAQARFDSPSDVAVAPDGTIYVADTLNHAIRRISPSGQVTTLNAPSARVVEVYPGLVEDSGDYRDGPLDEALFNEPNGLALDAKGNLYVSDTGNQCIRYIDFETNTVSTVAGDPSLTYADDALYKEGGFMNGDALTARFNYPKGIAATPDGGLIIADSLNHAIRYLHDGRVTTLAGMAGINGNQDAIDTAAKLHMPYDVALDREDNVYVADAYNNKIRKVEMYRFAGNAADGEPFAVFHGPDRMRLDAAMKMKDDRIFVPVRSLAKELGFETEWFDDTRLQLSKGDLTVHLKVGVKQIVLVSAGSDKRVVAVDAAPFVEDGHTYVPLRFVTEGLGADVKWIAAQRAAVVRDPF